MPRQKKAVRTRNRILGVAIQEFSRKGYRDTTITEICRLAGTNIGSVNYYFRDKETLYIEVWKEAFRHALEKHPIDGGVDMDAPAQDRLRGMIIATLSRIIDPECFDFEIVHMEMANPTGILNDAIKDCVDYLEKELMCILKELIGDKAREEDIQLTFMSIHSQCFNPMIFGKRHEAMNHDLKSPHPEVLKADLKMIAEHVIHFSLGGLKEVHHQIENRKKVGTEVMDNAHN